MRRDHVIVLLALLIFSAAGLPQKPNPKTAATPPNVRGKIIDPFGAVIPHARVTLKSRTSQTTTIVNSGADGDFLVPKLPKGEYELNVQSDGFAVMSKTFSLRGGTTDFGNIVLEVANGSTAVAVSAGPESRLTWNAWTEEYSQQPTFDPVARLAPNHLYSLTLDLSSLAYSADASTFHQFISSDLEALLKLRAKVTLDALIIPDQLMFLPQEPGDRSKVLEVDTSKLRAAVEHETSTETNAFELLKSDSTPSFEFGRVRVKIRSAGKTGKTSIAILLWVNGKPVDELSVPICIAEASQSPDQDPCASASSSTAIQLKGTDSLRIAAGSTGTPYPDAAIHLIEFNENRLVGVFKCNSCATPDQEYETWDMDQKAGDLSAYLTSTILNDFAAAQDAKDDSAYLRHGQELYRRLFRAYGQGLTPVAEKFNKFVMSSRLAAPLGQTAPSLFVRLLPNASGPLFLVPLSLMAIPNEHFFVGETFRIETPFASQSYAPPGKCISSWRLLVPPYPETSDPQDPLDKARKSFDEWIQRFRAWQGHAKIDDNLDAFSNWLSASSEAAAPSAVLILSHHANDELFFKPSGQTLPSVNVLRKFAQPSLVIMSACGTAKPGASDFLRSFNREGISTAIATSYEVDAEMAADFLNALMGQLDTHRTDDRYTLSEAKFDATHQLLPKYGPRILIFTLIGDGSSRACVPDSTPVSGTEAEVLQ